MGLEDMPLKSTPAAQYTSAIHVSGIGHPGDLESQIVPGPVVAVIPRPTPFEVSMNSLCRGENSLAQKTPDARFRSW